MRLVDFKEMMHSYQINGKSNVYTRVHFESYEWNLHQCLKV